MYESNDERIPHTPRRKHITNNCRFDGRIFSLSLSISLFARMYTIQCCSTNALSLLLLLLHLSTRKRIGIRQLFAVALCHSQDRDEFITVANSSRLMTPWAIGPSSNACAAHIKNIHCQLDAGSCSRPIATHSQNKYNFCTKRAINKIGKNRCHTHKHTLKRHSHGLQLKSFHAPIGGLNRFRPATATNSRYFVTTYAAATMIAITWWRYT